MSPFHKILCPIDFSEPSFRALLKAAEVAPQDAELYLLHVMSRLESVDTEANDSTEADDAMKNLHDLIRDYLPESLQAHSLVSAGDATDEILRVAREKRVNLIVMATHGSTGWHEFALGSVTDEIVRLAPCPVLTINDVALGKEKPYQDDQESGSMRGVADMTPSAGYAPEPVLQSDTDQKLQKTGTDKVI